MVQRIGTIPVLLALAVFALAPPVLAQPSPDSNPAQVVMKVSIVREAAKEPRSVRTHEILLRGDGTGSQVNSSHRIPIPSVPLSDGKTEGQPVASYTYQNVGLMLTASAWAANTGARLQGKLDDSSIVGREPLVVRSLSQNFDAYFPFGKPVRIAVLSDPDGATTSIEIQVDRVK